MEVIKIIGIALVALIIIVLLKQYKPEYTIFISLLAGALIILLVISSYNKFQVYIIRINEAETNIDSVLRKRFDLLNKSTEIIKEVTKTEDNVLVQVEKLKSKKLSNLSASTKNNLNGVLASTKS